VTTGALHNLWLTSILY